MAEVRTLQIWAPSNQKIRIPFSGLGKRFIPEDIYEGNPTHKGRTSLPIIDYDISSEDEDEEPAQYNEDEGDMIDDEVPDTHRDF